MQPTLAGDWWNGRVPFLCLWYTVDGSGGWSCDVERCPYSRAEHLVQPQQFQFQALKKNGNWPNKTWLANSISPRHRKHIREKIAQLVHCDFLSAGKVTVGGNQTMLKLICFYKTSHLNFKLSTRVSRNTSTFCLTNPDVCRPKFISCWQMRCLKREPACLISASFCRQISRRNICKA